MTEETQQEDTTNIWGAVGDVTDNPRYSFCGKLVALLALALILLGGAITVFTDGDYEIVGTYDEGSLESSGLGGEDTVNNTWN